MLRPSKNNLQTAGKDYVSNSERKRHRNGNAHIFAYDFLQCMGQNLPGENFHVFLDIARFRSRESHNDLEEVLAVCLRLRHRKRAEALEIPTNAILFLDRESYTYERLEEIDGVNARYKALVLAFPVDTADTDAVRCSVFRRHRLKVCMDSAAFLDTGKLHETSFRLLLLSCPVFAHGIEIAI